MKTTSTSHPLYLRSNCSKLFKTVWLLLSFCLLLSLMFSGCTEKAEKGKTVIHFVTWKPNIPEAWDEILKLFEHENPDIKVKREVGPHSSTAFHDLLTQIRDKFNDIIIDFDFFPIFFDHKINYFPLKSLHG